MKKNPRNAALVTIAACLQPLVWFIMYKALAVPQLDKYDDPNIALAVTCISSAIMCIICLLVYRQEFDK